VQAAPESPPPVSFGFFNNSGQLIIDHTKPDAMPVVYAKSVCESNRVLPLRFMQIQPGDPRNSHRHTAQNFDFLPGTIYALTIASEKANSSCLLTSDEFMPGTHPLPPLSASSQTLTPVQIERIEALQQRKISKSWALGEVPSGAVLYLVLFEHLDNQALASLILQTSDKVLFRDYPAKVNPYSTWRVDDGGSISPGQFKILMLRQRGQHWEMATEFWGAEGSVLEFLVENNGKFEAARRSYRYVSPF
jgi:hypothetical protein